MCLTLSNHCHVHSVPLYQCVDYSSMILNWDSYCVGTLLNGAASSCSPSTYSFYSGTSFSPAHTLYYTHDTHSEWHLLISHVQSLRKLHSLCPTKIRRCVECFCECCHLLRCECTAQCTRCAVWVCGWEIRWRCCTMLLLASWHHSYGKSVWIRGCTVAVYICYIYSYTSIKSSYL